MAGHEFPPESKPALVAERLRKLDDGRWSYALRYPLPDGKRALVLSGQQMMARLALLVPRPGKHLVRYKGVFASHSSFRPLIVPTSPRSRPSGHCAQPAPPTPTSPEQPTVSSSFEDAGAFVPEPAPAPRPRYLDWASLLRRVYGPDVLQCPRCQEPLKLIAFIEDKKVVRAILDHLGISPTGPPLAPARPRAQADLFA